MSAIRRSHANLPSLGYMGDGSVSWRREAGGRGLELVLRTCTTCTCSPLLAKTFLLGLWDFFESQTSRDRTTQCFSPPSSASGPRCPAPAETNDSRSSLPARVRHEECSGNYSLCVRGQGRVCPGTAAARGRDGSGKGESCAQICVTEMQAGQEWMPREGICQCYDAD